MGLNGIKRDLVYILAYNGAHTLYSNATIIVLIREVIQLTAEAFAYWDDVQICWEIHAEKVIETNFFSWSTFGRLVLRAGLEYGRSQYGRSPNC